ncbi:MAG: tryptophan-rich sensory protein [Cyanobacteria bacterium J06623_7]
MRDRYTVNSKPVIIRQIITFVTIIAAFATNIWANINPPNELTIGAISQSIFRDVLITPASYAFAVWGLIYLGLISFAVYQALPTQKSDALLHKIGYKIAIASIAQIVWVFCFLYRQFGASMIAMVCILLPLIAAYWSLPFKTRISRRHRWLVRTPVSIYLAWISLATVLNGALVLESWQWSGWGISSPVWTVIMLLIAGLITHLVTLPRLDFAYAGVFVWGVIAIAVRNADIVLISGTAIGLSISLIVLLLSFSFYGDGEGGS